MTKKETLTAFLMKQLDSHNELIVDKAARLAFELNKDLVEDTKLIDSLYNFYELLKEREKDISVIAAAKKLGASKSSKKALAAKCNAQKAGRHYEYIITGDDDRILGSATGRKKEELIEKLKQMFIDQNEINLKLISKASEGEIKLARQGTIITPTAVII